MARRDALCGPDDGVVQLGRRVGAERLQELADDGAFARCLGAVHDDIGTWCYSRVDESCQGIDLGVAAGEARDERREEVIGQSEKGGHVELLRRMLVKR